MSEVKWENIGPFSCGHHHARVGCDTCDREATDRISLGSSAFTKMLRLDTAPTEPEPPERPNEAVFQTVVEWFVHNLGRHASTQNMIEKFMEKFDVSIRT